MSRQTRTPPKPPCGRCEKRPNSPRRCSCPQQLRCLPASRIQSCPPPFWIVEEHVPGDRQPRPHIHVDFLYVALAGSADTVNGDARGEGLAFTWHTAEQLPGLDMFEATQLLGADLFSRIDALVVPARTI
jgi:hypothetical protein